MLIYYSRQVFNCYFNQYSHLKSTKKAVILFTVSFSYYALPTQLIFDSMFSVLLYQRKIQLNLSCKCEK